MELNWIDRDLVEREVQAVDFTALEAGSGLYFYGAHPFTGVSFVWGADGRLSGVAHLRDGHESGICVGWYPNGQVKVYNEMEGGVLHGWHRQWSRDGRLVKEERYVLGCRVAINAVNPPGE